jgi:hypothetical protein
MPPNPYEAPRESSEGPNQNAVLALRSFAVLMWLVAALWLWLNALVKSRSQNGGYGIDIVLVVVTLPTCGLFLLGLSGWWRIWWLAVFGLLLIAPMVIAFVFAFSGPT